MRVALTGPHHGRALPRPSEQDVPPFVDNIFRYVQAGSEVSDPRDACRRRVGYQPTLGTRSAPGAITSTQSGAITSVRSSAGT